jgi:hypothetical protein
MTDNSRSSVVAAGIVAVSVVSVCLLLGGAGAVASLKGLENAVRLPFLVMIGVVALLGVLAAMAIAFKTMHLANQTQALGLPEGSVRAVIALSLILIFAVVTVYLFSDLSNCKSVVEVDKSGNPVKTVSAPVSTSTVVTTTAGTTSTVVTTTDPNKPLPVSDEQKARAAASQDFAKQLLIMLGTLITSLTSFYFGSNLPAAGTSRPAPPKLTGIDPQTFAATSLPQSIKVQGTGLQAVDTVSLREAKGATVAGVIASLTDTLLTVTVPTGTTAGTCSVGIKTKDGLEAAAPTSLIIT